MKISLEWLSDFVDLSGIDPTRIADQLTMATAEVETVDYLERFLNDVVIGEIVDVQLLDKTSPGGPAKYLVIVDCGGNSYTTVTTAPNIRMGLKVPFALPGMQTANGLVVAENCVAGHVSQGMLCSAAELGLGTFHEIVLECPKVFENGALLADFVTAKDVIIEIDNKSLTHRPDLWGHYGIARELAAILRRPLNPLPKADLPSWNHLPATPLTIEDLDLCPAYACVEFDSVGDVPSPLWIQSRLNAVGQRSLGLLVDLTNYVMFELGQPLHAFDADKLHRSVRVGASSEKRDFTTLDGQHREILPGDLMIWSEDDPVAIAGIMGGLNSEVDESTSRVLLEAANFRGSTIRRTSTRLGLRSEASLRFEKSLPPVMVVDSTARFIDLMERSGYAPTVTKRFTLDGDARDTFRSLTIDSNYISRRAGIDVPTETTSAILNSLGFVAEYDGRDTVLIKIPPYRSNQDISIPEDIVEEVLRIYGYDNIEPQLPTVSLEPIHVNTALKTEHRVRRLLADSHRFIEVQTYAWFDDNWLKRIGYIPPRPLHLLNPTAQQCSTMRTSLIPNLLALIGPNRTLREEFRLFELGRVFQLSGDNECHESSMIAGVSYTQASSRDLSEHFLAIKGCVEELSLIGNRNVLTAAPRNAKGEFWQESGCWGELILNNRAVGSIGFLTGDLLSAVAEQGQVVCFELEMHALEGPVCPEIDYVPLPAYPVSWHDFSVLWSQNRGYANLIQVLDDFDHPLIRSRDFLYLYRGTELPDDQGSYTFRFTIGSKDRTLTGHEIGDFRSEFMSFLDKKGITLR